jgi:hypothetical protein
VSRFKETLDLMQDRAIRENGLGCEDSVDLISLGTVLLLREHQACRRLDEARLQIQQLLEERDRNRSIVEEAQRIAAGITVSLPGLLNRLEAAEQDVYISILVRAGAEITYQPCEAEKRSDESTFFGHSLDEAIALVTSHLSETT